MLFMIVEHFRGRDARAVYARLRERGRRLPEGVAFVDSWTAADLSRCFQLVECDDAAVLQRWIARWADLIDFEIVPVVPGAEAAEALAEDA